MKINIDIPEQPNRDGDWTVDFNWLEDLKDSLNEKYCVTESMEDVEAVILELVKRSKKESVSK